MYMFLLSIPASMFLVIRLTKKWEVSDYTFIIIGSVSSGLEYASFSLTLNPNYVALMWVAPFLGMLTNAQVALRSLPTKIVSPDEKGLSILIIAIR